MWLPTKIYESLPTTYIMVGASFILGATYLGSGHALMSGYMVVGLTCVTAGIFVTHLRSKARSDAESAQT